MSLEEKFSAAITNEREEEMLLLLKEVGKTERRALVPIIKKLSKHYEDYKPNLLGQYKKVGSDKQTDMLLLASFICFNQAEFSKLFFVSWIFQKKFIDKVSDWYVPDWISDLLNTIVTPNASFVNIRYDRMMELVETIGLKPAKHAIALVLPDHVLEHTEVNKKRVTFAIPERLEMWPATLSEHIWYLFQETSNIHYINAYFKRNETVNSEPNGWQDIFIELSKTKKLDRARLLRESLRAGNRNFSRQLSGWMADLFAKLEPEPAELLELQKDLLSILHSEFSKPVSIALQHLKKIAESKDLDITGVLDAAPAVLTSTYKSNVTGMLAVLEQIAKKNKTEQHLIANVCVQAFIHQDETIQKRVVKIIDKYANEEISIELANIYESLLSNTKTSLSKFLTTIVADKDDETHLDLQPAENVVSRESIPEIKTIEDLTYLAAQAFDGNEWFHIDLLPASLLNFQNEIKGDHIGKLQPALQRALQTIRNSFRTTMGYYDYMLAVFFVDICIHLVRKFPDDAKALTELFDHFDKKSGNPDAKFISIEANSSYISTFKMNIDDPFYKPYRELLTEALEKFRTGNSLPMLSTPTFRNGKIDARVLVERIIKYQEAGEQVPLMDGMIAISRVDLSQTHDAFSLAQKKLEGEWLHLLTYLLIPESAPPGKILQPEAWLMAALSKKEKQWHSSFEQFGCSEETFSRYLGKLWWEVTSVEYKVDRYDYQNQTNVQKTEQRKELHVNLGRSKVLSSSTFVSSLINKIKSKTTNRKPTILYDHLRFSSTFMSNENNDARRTMLLIPNNLEAFIPHVLARTMKYSNFFSEPEKKFAIESFHVLHELWDDAGEIAHLFLAAGMLCSDKTAASIAAEIWVKYTPVKKINHELLGSILGKYESIEFAPLKRFTDLILQSMFKISPLHNKMLKILIDNFMKNLSSDKIKGLKKLKEIYAEL